MNIALFGKTVAPADLPYFQSLIDRLAGTGGTIYLFEPFYQQVKNGIRFPMVPELFSFQADILGKVDFLFSIGGDGTLLDSVNLLGNSGIPVIGINMGRMGFLSTISREGLLPAVQEVLSGNFLVEDRSLLRLETKDNLFGEYNYALNDLTIYKKAPLSMLTIRVCINGETLNTYWADGLIVATPTGSTAYSMSCMGPILSPDAGVFVITPIASHNLTVRPIVVPDSSVITISLEGKSTDAFIGLDSRQVTVDRPVGLTVRKEAFTIRLLRLQGSDFYRTLREKLNWGRDIRN